MPSSKKPGNHFIKNSRWYTALVKAYERFLKIRGRPRDIALGMALGLFIAMTPTMGFQMIIAVFFASLLKWNKFSAAAGVWLTNPVTAPIIYGLCYLVGSIFYKPGKIHTLPDNIDATGIYQILLKAPDMFLSLTIGGVILGLPLAIIGYYVSYSLVKKYQENIKAKLARQKEKRAKKRLMKETRKTPEVEN